MAKARAKKPAQRIPDELADLAVPIGSLKPHPKNPRRGNVDAIRASLVRFGQLRPIVCSKGGVIVAGHHVWEGAKQEGWDQVAAIKLPLSPKEAAAYLLADNRTSDLARYDDSELAAIVGRAAKASGAGLEGTGYTDRDLQALMKRVAPEPPEGFQAIDPSGMKLLKTCPKCGYKW